MIWLEYRPETGEIINAIEYNGVSEYTPPEGIEILERGESDVWIGWTYDGETFIPPPEPEREPVPNPTPET